MTVFSPWNTRRVQAALVHAMQVNGDHSCQARFPLNNDFSVCGFRSLEINCISCVDYFMRLLWCFLKLGSL